VKKAAFVTCLLPQAVLYHTPKTSQYHPRKRIDQPLDPTLEDLIHLLAYASGTDLIALLLLI